MQNFKRFLVVSSVAFMALFLVGCGGSAINDNYVIIGLESDVVSLDPHAANTASSSQVNVQIFERLIAQDLEGNFHPWLATEWTQYDDRTYEFTLREGVEFHNGEILTAHDVVFTMQRAAHSPAIAAVLGEIDPSTVVAVDDMTVRIGTFEPHSALLNALAHAVSAILNEASVVEAGDDYDRHPIGTGPFEFVDRVEGSTITLTRFENYHGVAPEIEGLQFRVMVDVSARLMALETGELDISHVTRNDIARVEADENLHMHRMPNYQINYVGFNNERERFNNPLVRQAVSHAINVEEIHQTLMQGVGEVLNGPLAPTVWGAYEGLEGYAFDLDRARDLMAEAGYENGFDATMAINELPERREWAEAIQSQLREIGITVTISQMDMPTFLAETEDGNYDMFILSWNAVTGEADYGLHPVFHSVNHGAPGNRAFYTNTRVDELLDLGRSTSDPSIRLEAYHEVQQLIVEDAPWVFLTSGEVLMASGTNIGGLNLVPTNHIMFNTIYFTDSE